MVQEKLAQDQWDIAADLFPAVAQQLVFATKEPFLQPVYEFATPQMVFDHACHPGDAAFLSRPHTAASTAQGVANATDLALALDASPDNWTAALRSWETTQIQLGVSLQQLGTSLGNQSQFDAWQGQQLKFGIHYKRRVPRVDRRGHRQTNRARLIWRHYRNRRTRSTSQKRRIVWAGILKPIRNFKKS